MKKLKAREISREAEAQANNFIAYYSVQAEQIAKLTLEKIIAKMKGKIKC